MAVRFLVDVAHVVIEARRGGRVATGSYNFNLMAIL